MANTKSAKKAIKVNQRNASANKIYKTRIKTTEKKFLAQYANSTETSSKQDLQKMLDLYFKRIDLAVKKNLIHKNKAARKKSQLAKKLAKLGQ